MRFYFKLKLTINQSLIFKKLTIKIILIVASPKAYLFWGLLEDLQYGNHKQLTQLNPEMFIKWLYVSVCSVSALTLLVGSFGS